MNFFKDDVGQVSAELIIVIAALLAVAAVMVGQLNNTAQTGKGKLAAKATAVATAIDAIQ